MGRTVVGAGVATTTDLVLRSGHGDDAADLSALALRSKGSWGYDRAFLAACREELALAPSQAAASTVAVAAGQVAGFALLQPLEYDPRGGELAMLFVDPPFLGRGVGRLLLADATRQARLRGWTRLRIESDPDAQSFYVAHGARRVGTVPSGSVAGRELPLLELDLEAIERDSGSVGNGPQEVQSRSAMRDPARAAPSDSTGL